MPETLTERLHTPWARRIGVALILVVAVLVPVLMPEDKWVRVAALALVYAGLASGLNVLVGMTGLLDLGYIAFFVVGAYTTAILTVRVFVDKLHFEVEGLWWLLPVSFLAALAFAGIAGTVLGYPTLRARGDYLAIMTLAFGEIIRLVAINWQGLTGGAVGIRNVPPLAVGAHPFIAPAEVYYVVLAVVVVLLAGLAAIVSSPVGRAWVAIREDELIASAMGVRTRRYKLLAYVCGASVAGVIGVVFAHMQQFINPDSFTLEDNFVVLSLVILGGAGTLWGPIVGATAWIFFQEWARGLDIVQQHPELRTGVLALLVIVLMIARPQGIVSHRPRLTRQAVQVEQPDPAIATVLGAEAGPATLSVRGVGRDFGGLSAVDGVDLQVTSGEVLGLMGPNGAGKSTLLNVISGITPPSRGTVDLDGVRLDGRSPDQVNALGVARTFQNIRLFADLTVMENLLVGGHHRFRTSVLRALLRTPRLRSSEEQASREAAVVLSFVGLWEDRGKVASTLSYGHQRRVEIARALMSAPLVLLLDEPAAGMNETETDELAQLVLRIRDAGVGVVLIEHDMTMLMAVSDRVVVLDHGELLATGRPDEIRADSAVLEAYLGTQP